MRLVRTEYVNPNTGTVRTGSTGHGESLADVETYLLPLTGALLRGALGSGVAQGLEVTVTVGQQDVTVGTGLAVDGTGRPIVLDAGGAVVVDANAPPLDQVQNVPLALVGSDGAELSTSGLTGAQVLTATAREALDGTAGAASWSLAHAPWLQLVPQATFTDDGTRVPLALVTLDAAGAVSALDAGPRRQASPALGGITLRRTTVTGGTTPSVDAEAGPTLQSRPDGGLDVLLPGSPAPAVLSVEGTTGRVGIGAGTGPLATPLQVGGVVHTGGPDAGLSFMDRHVAGYVDTPTAGQRWVWYADAGCARLWSGTDQLSVGQPGDGGGLDIPRRMRVRQGPDASAGIWFWQNAVPNAAFAGMSDDGHVGLWGHGAGWGLTMDVASGIVNTRTMLVVGGVTPAPLLVTGGVTVGSGHNAVLTTRHVNGKAVGNDGDDDLYLNWVTGRSVHVGGGAQAALAVHGPAVVDTDLRCDGAAPPPSWSGGGVCTFDLFAAGAVYVGQDFAHPKCAFYSDGTKHFIIDHPLDPENRSLNHVCLEGPEAAVYYRGSGRLVDGRVEVELPEYFEALVCPTERTVMLTAECEEDEPVGVLAASPVRDGRFTVRAAAGTNPDQRFHWEVKAVRADVVPLVVEPVKQSRELAGVGSSARGDR